MSRDTRDASKPLQSCKTWHPPRCTGSGGRQYCTSAPQSQVQQVSAASPALGSQAHAGETWSTEPRRCCGRRLSTVSTEVEGSASSGGALPGGAQSTACVAGLRSILRQPACAQLGRAAAQAAPWRAGAGALCATDHQQLQHWHHPLGQQAEHSLQCDMPFPFPCSMFGCKVLKAMPARCIARNCVLPRGAGEVRPLLPTKHNQRHSVQCNAHCLKPCIV